MKIKWVLLKHFKSDFFMLFVLCSFSVQLKIRNSLNVLRQSKFPLIFIYNQRSQIKAKQIFIMHFLLNIILFHFFFWTIKVICTMAQINGKMYISDIFLVIKEKTYFKTVYSNNVVEEVEAESENWRKRIKIYPQI